MKIQKDGNMWCVTKDDFINLQESDALFITDEEYNAFITSIKQEERERMIKEIEDVEIDLNIEYPPEYALGFYFGIEKAQRKIQSLTEEDGKDQHE